MHILRPEASLTNDLLWLLMLVPRLVLNRHELDIIGITETFLDDSVYDSHILFLGYVAYRRDHERHDGGVMILAMQERYYHSTP